MLPQERFAFKFLYEDNFLGRKPMHSTEDIESLMAECHLKYREGKTVKDLREAFWGSGAGSKHSIDAHTEWALERADKVWTINWQSLAKSR